ncbi:hypothetical protein ACWDZ6_02100 [Streptomyces sp. NPDC002926]
MNRDFVHAEVRVGDYEDIAADQDMNDRRVAGPPVGPVHLDDGDLVCSQGG